MVTTDLAEPQNIEAEQAVLGSCLIDRDAIVRLAPLLRPDAFMTAQHQVIYRAILALYWRQTPPELLTVVDELERSGELERAGDEVYLSELISATPTSVHAPYYADIVNETATRRRMIRAARDIAKHGYTVSDDLRDSIAAAEDALSRATQGYQHEGIRTMSDIVDDYIASMDVGNPTLINFGMRQLDNEILGGVAGGDLVIVAARTSTGKSAFAGNIVRYNAGTVERRVMVVSLEMRAQEYVHRLIAMDTGIDSRKIANRGLPLNEHERWIVTECGTGMKEWPLLIDDRSSGRIEDVCARVRNADAQYDLNLLIVDHMALMRSAEKTGNRNLEMGIITSRLKQLAMELEIPVIAMHQLSRAHQQRENKTPILSDLRDSGNVEQDADIVVFLHRPGMDDPLNHDREVTNVYVAKHRNGPVGRLSMMFDERTTKFRDRKVEQTVGGDD